MSKKPAWNWIPTVASPKFFNEFILEHLTCGSRGPERKLSDIKIFNYILKFLHTGCQWENLPINKDENGDPEIHYTCIYKTYRMWEKDQCFDAIFTNTVQVLHDREYLDTSIIHGDGTTTSAKKGATILGEMAINT
jgi:hypothetical protein